MVNFSIEKRGFTLLYASLVGALLLSIGLAVFNIASKQFLLSATERESQIAFFAADTGIECALYHIFSSVDVFATTTGSDNTFVCNGVTYGGAGDPDCCGGQGYGVPSTFQMNFAPSAYCAVVSVIRNENSPRTIIEARGYNTCETSNPRRVERGLRATFP